MARSRSPGSPDSLASGSGSPGVSRLPRAPVPPQMGLYQPPGLCQDRFRARPAACDEEVAMDVSRRDFIRLGTSAAVTTTAVAQAGLEVLLAPTSILVDPCYS